MTAAPEPARTGLGRLPKIAWAALTAAALLFSNLVGPVYTVFPWLKPDPREQIAAELSVFAVEPHVTIGDWAQRAYPGSWQAELNRIFHTRRGEHVRPDLLANEGDVIYVHTQVDGYKHRFVSLRWAVYDKRGCRIRRHECRFDYNSFAAAPPIPAIAIDAPNRSSVQLLFIPGIQDLDRPARTFVRIELRDDTGTLAVTDTPALLHGVPL